MAIGLAPVLFWPAVARAIGAWRPAWATAELPAPLYTLGFAHLGLFILLMAAGIFLWRKVKSNGLRRGPTWDCGYAAPTARMQYSSGSFGGLSGEWFAWILRPVLKRKRPNGPFPVEAIHVERIPETVLERVVTPVGGWFILLSTAVRRLQHGRLQAYILYVVLGLVVLGVCVFLGGEP